MESLKFRVELNGSISIWVSTLFITGVLLSLLLMELQKHHRVLDCESHQVEFKGSVILFFGIVCGLSAVLVGSMFPYFDCLLTGKTHRDELGYFPLK